MKNIKEHESRLWTVLYSSSPYYTRPRGLEVLTLEILGEMLGETIRLKTSRRLMKLIRNIKEMKEVL